MEAGSAGAERRRRMTQLAVGAVLLAGILIAVLIAVSQSGGDEEGGDPSALSGVGEVKRELAGLEQDGTVLGPVGAPATIAEYADLQCPACAEYSQSVLPAVIDEAVRGGRARLDFRPWVILSPVDGDSGVAARAALAAGEQDRLWEYVGIFYRNQGAENSGYVTDEFLRAVAEAAGVPDLDRWEEDREDPRWEETLGDVNAEATGLGFNGTPSFAVDGPGGTVPLGSGVSGGDIVSALPSAASQPQ